MKQRAILGIEIASDEVRGAHVRITGSGIELAGVASAPVPEQGMDADGVLSAPEMAEAIRRICTQLDVRANQVVFGMTGCNLVARVMEIPPVPQPEIRAVLRGEMDHYRILPAGQSAFDFYRLPEAAGREGAVEGAPAEAEGVARVLLMGAEERIVASYRATADAAHLNMGALEPSSIAVIRALYPMLCAQRSVATVIVSAMGTDVFITQEGALQFYRRIDTGLPELRTQTGLAGSAERAPSHSQQSRGSMLFSEDEDLPTLSAPMGIEEADPYNRQAVSLLMTEVQRSLDYFSREFPVGEEMLVRFALDASDAEDLFRVMAQYLRSDAEMATVMDSLFVTDVAREAMSGPQGVRYTAAVGLALRACGGEFAEAPRLDLGVGDRIMEERRIAPRALFVSVAASGLILLGTIASALLVGNQVARMNQRLVQGRHELQSLTQEHAQKVGLLDRQKNIADCIHNHDKPMREAIEFVSAAVSRRACLTNLSIDANGLIVLSGDAANSRVVADVMDTINLSPTLEPIRLNSIMRSAPDKSVQTYHFDMQTGILKNAPQTPAPPQAANGMGDADAKGGI